MTQLKHEIIQYVNLKQFLSTNDHVTILKCSPSTLLNFLTLLSLSFPLALGIYLFFPAVLVSRASEWLGREKKVMYRETIQLYFKYKGTLPLQSHSLY